MFVDSHTHLFLESFSDDRDAVIERALKKGVTKMLLPNIDVKTIPSLYELSDKYSGHCFPMMGLHPTSVKEDYREQLRIIEAELNAKDFVAIGETGIDLFWDGTYLEEQKDAFKTQIRWAKNKELPIVIHSRESFNEIFELLDEALEYGQTGVFHSFSGNIEQAEKALSYGFYIGINGIVTFKNNNIEHIVGEIPIERILLETDAPFLSPMPYRGKRNESSYLSFIAEKISEIHKLSIEQVAAITTSNALNLFNRLGE